MKHPARMFTMNSPSGNRRVRDCVCSRQQASCAGAATTLLSVLPRSVPTGSAGSARVIDPVRRHQRAALTLLELLVALAIVSLLAALVLPAIQHARESARRITCVSHLRQMGLACESFVATRRTYPTSVKEVRDAHGIWVSHHVLLLPHLERADLFQEVGPREFVLPGREPPRVDKDPHLLNEHVTVFVCPSDNVPVGGNSYRGCFGTTPGLYHTWRPGRRPPPPPGTPSAQWGIMMMSQPRTPARVTDGLSQTALFSERVVGDQDPARVTPWRDVYVVPPSSTRLMTAEAAEQRCRSLTTAIGHYSGAGRAWVAGYYHHAAYNHVLPPNSPVPDCAFLTETNFTGAMTARSLHPGGVNVCFGDGSVRFISETIDLQLWRALGTMYGAEAVSLSSL